MTERNVQHLIADMEGAVAMPRKNGELVFASPWEARAFGLAIALHDQGHYNWESFRSLLIEEIGLADEQRDCTDNTDEEEYYEHWSRALHRLLLKLGMVDERELAACIERVKAENAHDHPHDH